MAHSTWRTATTLAVTAVLGLALCACSGVRVADSDGLSGSASDDVQLTTQDRDVATQVGAPAREQAQAPRYGLAEAPGVFGAASGSGCGLPCEAGTSQWHGRAVFGRALFTGDDDPESCNYFGFDIGANWCDSCWSIDAFYRQHGGRFDRAVAQPNGLTTIGLDGGDMHHIGIKLAFQSSLGLSKFYGWFGVGPSYFWTDDYVNDDEGFGFYVEAGLGYNLSNNWRIRAGVNVHGFDTDVTRLNAVDDGQGRFLLVIAPVIQLEGSF